SFTRSLALSIEASWQKMTRVYDSVRFFIAPSRYIRDVFIAESFPRESVVYLAPFVRATELDATPSLSATTPDGLPERYVVYFGRLSSEKGLSTLLDAIGRLARVPLVVCGDGPLRHLLEEQASAARAPVHFRGHLGRREHYAVVHRAVAAVLPSESPENAPYTVLEAMAMGIPVVVSNMGGLPELASTGGGIVFEAGDAVGLAETLHELWDNENLAGDIGKRGRRSVIERFGEELHLEGLEEVYRKAIGAS
ncbi:MAG: glycosyltransferase, partial [Candidatus Krumholzibacteriota bacterium]|nr:glycosyltransferase [Candidatus Krumholzibacteriota bacterium]